MDYGDPSHAPPADEPPDSPVAEALPEREQADHEVAAGSVGGVCAGAVVWLVAMFTTRGEGGFLLPLRLVGASLLGDAALDSGAVVGPVVVGMLLAGMVSVLFGLVYVSVLPQGARTPAAMLVGLVYAAAVWAVAWTGVARVLAPVLHAAAEPMTALGLHALYGLLLGLVVPFLRKILP
ncbi:MAG TPA: hypothetical protein VFR85_10735 [Anaeromyxobacteraceae bacterium]|nr:hypothetical protein [Anaeromyxobacteraceae bacterium]